ncbi:lysozyme inhibitor LprI family protein [Faecalibacter sp. LW9]|uniref:lysozyme inhibitor LprI family protein n=1 Tax=Faecalibacter sp. LW9 TaxID=3103144 RepID=UPI002AFF3386|nr:lysozyme inhibitor LprI family protein [Faecalibacter sp. LW9]
MFTIAQSHDIDLSFENCLNDNTSTNGQRKCINDAEMAWDHLLDKYYKLLLHQLPEKPKIQLKNSQIQWLKFRDAEFKFINEYYMNFKEGSIFLVIADHQKMEIIKNRALKMKAYYDALDD